MKKLLLICLLFVSVNSFSQKLPGYHIEDKTLITSTFNGSKSLKKYNNYGDYARRAVNKETIIGGTIFGTLLILFVKGAINVYKLNRN